MPRSRIEALLASFPKLADSGTQHTTVEQDNVRFVYQPLDELYMVLITNRQSNILQDIDSLHLFAQVVTSTCKSLEEREILKNAFELLSAFDELVTLGYRENLTISQIKTFLEMESHEERIQEIIARNKELEATEERKRKAKQLEMQRKESARGARGMGNVPRTPVYPTYTAPSRPAVTDTYDSYEAEKNKSKFTAPKGKGMQLGKKSKTTDMFERVRGEMGNEVDDSPLVAPAAPSPIAAEPSAPRASTTLDRDAIHVTINEAISAKLSKEGAVESIGVSGDLQLRISDPSLTKIKLDLNAQPSHGAQFRTHPNVDRNLFNSSRTIQMANTAKGFPVNNSVGVLRWRATPKADDPSAVPISFTVWVNKGSDGSYTMTVEYELTGGDALKDVSVTIPYSTAEPSVSSFDATYDVSGDSLEWSIGTVDEENPNGAFEFEAQADDENEFFPMQVRFSKTTPFVDVDVSSVTLVEMNEDVTFSKEIKSMADSYVIDDKSYCVVAETFVMTTVSFYIWGSAHSAGQRIVPTRCVGGHSRVLKINMENPKDMRHSQTRAQSSSMAAETYEKYLPGWISSDDNYEDETHLSTLDCVLSTLPFCLVADLENLIFPIFVIFSLQSIRDSALRGIIEDLCLIPDTRAGLAEGIPEGTNNDVRDPHLPQSETMWPHPNQNHNGCIKIEMAYACSAEKQIQNLIRLRASSALQSAKARRDWADLVSTDPLQTNSSQDIRRGGPSVGNFKSKVIRL
ncbi:coatomer subunit delta [Diaporthe eres]|nr:coatomer subunit delta [Diaporthe eres]